VGGWFWQREEPLLSSDALRYFGGIGTWVRAEPINTMPEPSGPVPKSTRGACLASITTVSTVGYGDFYRVTIGGKLCAVQLMVVGIGTFASIAGLMTHLIHSLALPEMKDEAE
jgi:hypothetical protein